MVSEFHFVHDNDCPRNGVKQFEILSRSHVNFGRQSGTVRHLCQQLFDEECQPTRNFLSFTGQTWIVNRYRLLTMIELPQCSDRQPRTPSVFIQGIRLRINSSRHVLGQEW